jgi:hypothetical protein
MALYGYKFALPTGLSNDQKKKLINLANKTASNASVKDTGKFRGGWRSSILGDTLTVSNDVVYSYFVEMGKGYNAHNKYKVRNALLRIGFEDMFQGTVGTLAIAAGVAVATTGSTATAATGTESSQEGASSQNTAQSTAPTTLFTNEELLALTTPKMLQDALQSKIGVSIPKAQAKVVTQNLNTQSALINMQSINDTTSLLALIAAAVVANELTNEEDDGKDSNQKE